MARDNPRLSIVIPVYGSARIIPDLLASLARTLVPLFGENGFEVILAHDAGPDDAWRVIESLAPQYPWLGAIDLRMNAGQHNAVMAGLAHATGDRIVTMDDDLQHAPDDIPRLLAALDAGADVAYARFGARQHAAWKLAGSWFNDVVARRLLAKPANLYLSPFRAMTRAIRDDVLKYEGPFVYVDGLILQATRNIATVDVEHHARSDGRSGYSFRKSVSLWLKMATSFSVAPLRLVSAFGVAASMLGFVLAAVVVAMKLFEPTMAVGWASLIVAVLFMGGVQLIALGAIGEYVGRVLLTLNRKPQYTVRQRLGRAQRQ